MKAVRHTLLAGLLMASAAACAQTASRADLLGALSPLAVDQGVPAYVPQGLRCGAMPWQLDHEAYVQRLARTPVADLDLFELVYLKNAEARLRERLQAGANPNVCGGPLNVSLLSFAAGTGDVKLVQLLLAHGAHLEQPLDDAGGSAFIQALMADRYDVAQLLMARGADVHITTTDGRTALHALANANRVQGRYQPARELALARRLLRMGLSPNAQDRQPNGGFTPVALAVLFNQPELVRLFMAHGADLSLTDAKGRTALQLARQLDRGAVLRVLEGR